MNVFKRAASALLVAAALFTSAAFAEDAPETRFTDVLQHYGIPDGLITWSSVEETPTGLVAHGVQADLTSRGIGLTTVPLGDLELSGIVYEGPYLTHVAGRFTGISADLPALMAAGQAIGQSGTGGQLGMTVVMVAGYIQGLGYSALDLTIDFESAVDFASGAWRQSASVDVANAFKFDLASTMSGVTPDYVDWARVNGAAFAFDPAKADASAPGDAAYARFDIAFDDQGVLAKFAGPIAGFRARFLGTNADGTPKTELSDDDLAAKAREMAAGGTMPADKLMPLVRAAYGFLMNPDIFALTATFAPAMTLAEFHAVAAAGSGGAKPAKPFDWGRRLTFEAHN